MDLKSPQTLIFLGPSGCGKGTQIKLVKEYLKGKGNELPVVNLVMVNLFRSFWKTEGYSKDLSKKIENAGGLQPGFMQIRLWSQFFVDNLTGGEHLIIDGSPRRLIDAKLMESAFDFYKHKKPMMVFINCSDEISRDRLHSRAKIEGREDDLVEGKIEGRLEWFHEHVQPAIDYFKDKEKFNFVEIDGNVGIQEVFEQIKEKVLEA
jgi:adenylate kinase family enzyme